MVNYEFLSLKQYFNDFDFCILTNVITNLSDTKYVLILSNLTYEIKGKNPKLKISKASYFKFKEKKIYMRIKKIIVLSNTIF